MINKTIILRFLSELIGNVDEMLVNYNMSYQS